MSAAEVDAYLATLDGVRAERVAAVVALVRERDGIAEAIEYGMPMFRRGEASFAVKSWKSYVSLYVGRAGADRLLASDAKLKRGGGCVNVTDGRPMPLGPLEEVLAEIFG